MRESREKSVVTEVGIFSIGIAFLLGIAAYSMITQIEPSAPPLLGMSRPWGMATPTIAVALLNVFAGVAVLVTRTRISIYGSMIAAVCVFLAYVGLIGFGVNLLAGVMLLIPIVVIHRGRMALTEIG